MDTVRPRFARLLTMRPQPNVCAKYTIACVSICASGQGEIDTAVASLRHLVGPVRHRAKARDGTHKMCDETPLSSCRAHGLAEEFPIKIPRRTIAVGDSEVRNRSIERAGLRCHAGWESSIRLRDRSLTTPVPPRYPVTVPDRRSESQCRGDSTPTSCRAIVRASAAVLAAVDRWR
jgi:hypothetical protein